MDVEWFVERRVATDFTENTDFNITVNWNCKKLVDEYILFIWAGGSIIVSTNETLAEARFGVASHSPTSGWWGLLNCLWQWLKI